MPTTRKRLSRAPVGKPDNFEMIFELNIWPDGVLEEMQRKHEEMFERDRAWHEKLRDGTWANEETKVIEELLRDVEII